MKSFKKYRIAAIIAALAVVTLAACEMVIEKIIFPENAQVNREETITVKIKLVTETDDNSQMVFAVLAPKSWNLKQNASLTLTTEGYTTQGYDEVVNEPLTLIPDTETEKSTALSYPMAYQTKIGLMGNTGPVEWTVFKTSTVFHINDKVSKEPIYGTITLKVKTGPDPIKFFMGFGFCGTSWGLDTESGEGRYTPNERAEIFTVHGSGPMLDFTTIQTITATPSVFRYGDIFSVNYDADGSALSSESKVYLCGKVELSDGSIKELNEAKDDVNLMKMTGETSFMKYIYPKSLFGVPAGMEIVKLYVWFRNADGTVIEKDGEDGYLLQQSAE